MKIEQLLEKKEQLQVMILRELVLQGGVAAVNQLRKQIHLSKSSFDQYMEEISMIGVRMGKRVVIKRNEFQVILELTEDVSLEKILLFLVRQSLKFKLLVHLLEHHQAISPILSLYLSRTAAELSEYEPLMFYSFFVSFGVLDEASFYQYDLTRSKKLPTAVLDTYIRETIVWHYRPRRLNIQEEKAVGYQLAQINNEFYFFQGTMMIYDQEHLLHQQKKMLGQSLSQEVQCLD